MKDMLKEIGLWLVVFTVVAPLLIVGKFLLIYISYLIKQIVAWIA